MVVSLGFETYYKGVLRDEEPLYFMVSFVELFGYSVSIPYKPYCVKNK